MDSSAEADLIARCQRGEAKAWDELFEAYYPATARFLFQLSSTLVTEDVEELCQEVFLAVVRNLGTFHGGSQLQTWIFRIAVNKARDHRERMQAAKRGGGKVPISLQAEDPETGLSLDPAASNASPDAELLKGEQMELIRMALDRLGEPCREIIELRYFGDLSYDEIARSLKLNPKTVSSRLSKCLDRLEMIARPIFGRRARFSEKPANSPV